MFAVEGQGWVMCRPDGTSRSAGDKTRTDAWTQHAQTPPASSAFVSSAGSR
jgi:hypothetical protein